MLCFMAKKPAATSNRPKPGDKRLTFDVPDELRQRIKMISARTGKTVRELVVDQLKSWSAAEAKRLRLP
jgi:hypothetical protein